MSKPKTNIDPLYSNADEMPFIFYVMNERTKTYVDKAYVLVAHIFLLPVRFPHNILQQ